MYREAGRADRPRLPSSRRAGRRFRGGDDRRPRGEPHAAASAKGLSYSQCTAVRFLYTGDAVDSSGASSAQPQPFTRRNSVAHLGQLLPVYRLPRNRGRGGRGSSPAGKRRGGQMNRTESRISLIDRPNSYIGRSVPRPNVRRLLHGRGQYTDDLSLPRMVHVAFLRSPYAHARIEVINAEKARTSPGVVHVAIGSDIARLCMPWVGVLTHFSGLRSPPQFPLAMDRVLWCGEPVVAVVAETRAEAEDALELLVVDFEELPAVANMDTALDPDST